MNQQTYYNELMKSLNDAIRSGNGIIDIAQCRAIELEQKQDGRSINQAEGQEAKC